MSQSLGAFGICTRCARTLLSSSRSSAVRSFNTSAVRHAELEQPPVAKSDPSTTTEERTLGPRRRREAIESTPDVPFTQLPYQCFQEALSVLREDRAEKVVQIEQQRKRIAHLELKAGESKGADRHKILRSLNSSKQHLEWLKVQADINDPVVKRRFEDGLGDMAKPVYRHLARQKWESYERKIVIQRITQMHVVPDVMSKIDPSVQVRLRFGQKKVAHGVVIPSTLSEKAPTLDVQSFEAGEKLVTIAVADSDIPNPKTDAFDYRLHALCTNVKITPTNGTIQLGLSTGNPSLVVPWLPPTAQKGAPWHRLSVWIFEQPDNKPIDAESIKQRYTRETFNLRGFEGKYLLKPIGATMFRTKWDDGMRGVMERHGIQGADVEYKLKAIHPMRYKKKDGARFR